MASAPNAVPTIAPWTGQSFGLAPETANKVAAVILALTVSFNALLAIFNGHVATINANAVAGVQGLLVIAALTTALLAWPEGIMRCVALTVGWLVLVFLLMLLREGIDPKIVGDALLLPAFVALGLTIRRPTLINTLLLLQLALIFFVMWELLFPTSFGDVFKVRDYYVATRGFSESQFWAGDDNLFLSSQRPGGRILSLGFDLNRGSSLFLEPVGLGNWTIVVTVALATFWNQLTSRERWLLLISNLILLYGCDGRLAMANVLLLLATMPLSWRLPRIVPVLYLPAVFIGIGLLIGLDLAQISIGEHDTFVGRFTYGWHVLQSLDLQSLVGLAPINTPVSYDSGWAFIAVKQSIFGLALLWLAVTLIVPFQSDVGRRYSHAAGLFVALALPVSNSVLSIKMAAALWMIAGCATAQVLAQRRLDAPVIRYGGAALAAR